MFKTLSVLLFCIASASATLVWNGNFNDYATSADLDLWSFSNQVGEYQCYIYGNGNGQTCSTWVHLDASYKNPMEKTGTKGARFEINGNSRWNNDVKERTELIPNIQNSQYQQGTVYYKWSMKMDPQNPLNGNEHQLVFFESHMCEVKYGGSQGNLIQFWANGQPVWTGTFTAGTWYNFAFEVNYAAQTCAFLQNTNGQSYAKLAGPVSVSASISDFHVGILRLPDSNNYQNPASSYLYYSGVYIESTTLTSSNFGSAPATTAAAPATTGRVVATTGQATTGRVVATTGQATTGKATTGSRPATTGTPATTGRTPATTGSRPATTGTPATTGRTQATTGSLTTTGRSVSTTGQTGTGTVIPPCSGGGVPSGPDTITISKYPFVIANSGSFSIVVAYSSTANRIIVVDVMSSSGTWYGKGTLTVGPGTGTVSVPAQLSSTPPAGPNYVLHAWMVDAQIFNSQADPWNYALSTADARVSVGTSTIYAQDVAPCTDTQQCVSVCGSTENIASCDCDDNGQVSVVCAGTTIAEETSSGVANSPSMLILSFVVAIAGWLLL